MPATKQNGTIGEGASLCTISTKGSKKENDFLFFLDRDGKKGEEKQQQRAEQLLMQ
jgi:hypothetical protein